MKKRGFTLVELSIVLVIIGLLIGGILVGQSLVESAKLKKVIQQISGYDILVSNFITKYKQLPGDSNLFGDYNPASTWRFNNDKVSDGSGYESGRAWEHLSKGLGIKNIYGENYIKFDPFSTPTWPITEHSCPKLYNIDQNPNASTPCLTISFPSYFKSTGYYMYNADPPAIAQTQGILSPKTLMALDKKLDDGTASGYPNKIFASGTNCINGTAYRNNETYDCMWVRIRIGVVTSLNK